MRTFVDTSALYALLDEGDRAHGRAAAWFEQLAVDDLLVTHNYIVVESTALVGARLGAKAVQTLLDDILPSMAVVFVDEQLHDRASAAYRASLSRRVSLVDRVSFEFMRSAGIGDAFAFDADFAKEGFSVSP